ncbi:MAG: V-type ATP synthase subunit D [Ruminococcus sp.]|nr:V-type ATP synthase subunit D [Ruminococcus sp.]
MSCEQRRVNSLEHVMIPRYQETIKAIPHNSGVRIAQQDFSSGCTNKSR